ncbi:reverse transcriptase domain-containing protein [Tanacetum coccineum]|uniref:Reverse transcriptase domain-containing protein n=1 Tax=Tanacetum coccineum TaxID=301880 RepID=A0ABQ4ZTM4_9ASTR
MMTDKYCPRGKIKKLEIEMWNLKVKGTDVVGYNQRFQELSLLCSRMFPEESDEIEKYVGGLPDMIHGSVMASKPKTMQDAIEFETELMDKKISTLAERQAENKRKLNNNNQAQQQPPKKQGMAITYTARPSEKKEYARTLSLYNKPIFHRCWLRVRAVAYKLELPQELSRVHHTFHVSNLKKSYADEPLAVLLDGLYIDDKLHFIEEPVEIMDYEVKRLKQSHIPIIKKIAPKKRTTRASPATITTTTPVTNAQLKTLIDQGIVDALAARDTDRSKNGDNSHDSGGDGRRQTLPARIALTWWNSHVKTVTYEVAYAMTWKTLKKMMTDKYYPRDEIKKLEIEMWNLKVKGTDVVGYNQHFQELSLICSRMFHEESDEIEKYVGGLPDMIYGSVMASKPKTMQDAIEFATEQIDKNISTLAKRQAENKRKLDNNNQAQQQPPKKQGMAITYTARPSEKKEYARTLSLYNKCKFHHNDRCTIKCANCKRVGHLTQDYRSLAATNNQRNLICYECGN